MRNYNSPPSETFQDFSAKPPVPDAVKDNKSKFATAIWSVIIHPLEVESTFKQSEIAETVETSTRTVRKVLQGFQNCNLIQINSYNGQGVGVKIKNLWLRGWKEIRKKIKTAVSYGKAFKKEAEYLKNNWKRNGQPYPTDRMKSIWSEVLDVIGVRDKEKTLKDEKSSNNFKSSLKGKENQLSLTNLVQSANVGEQDKFWSNRPIQRAVMNLVRKIIWVDGQDKDTSDEARELNQFICNAVGKVFKDRDIRFGRAVEFIEHLRDGGTKYLIKAMKDAWGDKFSALMDKVKEWLSPTKYIGVPFCKAENGKEFLNGDYDSAIEAERAKARYNRRISQLNINFPDQDYKPMTQQEFDDLKREIRRNHDGDLEKYLDHEVRSFHDLDEKWKISKRKDFKSFNDPIKREKKDEFFVTGGSSETEEPEDELPF